MGCGCCKSGPVYKFGGPTVSGGTVTPNFEDGKLFRIEKKDTWYYYNDTQEYYMHVVATFGAGSEVTALGKAEMSDKKADGSCTVKLDILPLETLEFIKAKTVNGFTAKFSASGFTPAEKTANRSQAEAKVAKEMQDMQKYVGDTKNSKELLRKARSKSKPFVDLYFPPQIQSIQREGIDDKNILDPSQYFWKRPDDFLPGKWKDKIALYVDKIKPGDIDQGGLGDCYFLCSVAALAEYSDVVKALFKNTDCCCLKRMEEKRGGYQVMLNIHGWWRVIVIDSYLPTRSFFPCFASNKTSPNEMWPCFIEKAYAKAYGSYSAIVAGFAWQALEDISGFPCYDFDKEWHEAMTDEGKADKLFEKLDKWSSDDYLISIGTPNKVDEEKFKQLGLGSGHAYSVLEVHHFPIHRLCLIKVRNPWGDDVEWTGDWSDDSPKWKEYPLVRLKCGLKSADDGTYWMEWKDVVKYFDTGCVCYLKRGLFTSWWDYRIFGEFNELIPNIVVEIIVTSGKFQAFASLRQRDRRGMAADDVNRQYAAVMLSISEGSAEGTAQEVKASSSANPKEPSVDYTFNITRSVSVFHTFEKGKKYYIIPRRMKSSNANMSPKRKFIIALASDCKLGTKNVQVNFRRLADDSPVFSNIPNFESKGLAEVETVFQAKKALGLPSTRKGTNLAKYTSLELYDYENII